MTEVMGANMERSDIAVVILTLNESETIEHAISSVGWSDDVFVVDSGSTDGTVEKASKLGAKVLVHRQDGPFLITEQRNWAVKNLPTEKPWVLFLDADELSTPEFVQAILDEINSNTRIDGLYAAPAFMYHGVWLRRCSGFPNWHPRAVRRGSGLRFTGGVWEEFTQGYPLSNVQVPYVHNTNAKGLTDWLEKHDRYAKWEANMISEGVGRKSERRSLLRRLRYSLGALRKYFALIYLAIVRGGLLDGPEARSYLKRMFIYELLIDEHYREMTHLRRGKGL
ncbi:glycosyltransferase family 2 protein [Arthrobacter sp. S39]|uniref:glycosyltransferase family 2 protein n=1 Tax=Arthrobacter sp. S39 TaxID=2509720 RepID=UPI0010374361|nr:glycosyltransferase family 2 protein [Arthrobacter sp. S39]TAP39116.1 glycosyltransferase family 2 protein [Arthrobacter sp. S39]